jgi:hypothetical protein
MKSKSIIISSLLMLPVLFAIPAWGQYAAPADQIKAKWTKAFEDVISRTATIANRQISAGRFLNRWISRAAWFPPRWRPRSSASKSRCATWSGEVRWKVPPG